MLIRKFLLFISIIFILLGKCNADDLWQNSRAEVNHDNLKCYQYANASILIDSSLSSESGANIFINAENNSCTTSPTKVYSLADFPDVSGRNLFFKGVLGNYLLLDDGCCPGIRNILIYDLKSHQQLSVITYLADDVLPSPRVKGGKLYFWQVDSTSNLKHCKRNQQAELNDESLVFAKNYVLNLQKKPFKKKQLNLSGICRYTQ